MDAGGVFLPLGIHVVNVVGVRSAHEVVLGRELPQSYGRGWEAHLSERAHSGTCS